MKTLQNKRFLASLGYSERQDFQILRHIPVVFDEYLVGTNNCLFAGRLKLKDVRSGNRMSAPCLEKLGRKCQDGYFGMKNHPLGEAGVEQFFPKASPGNI